MLVGDTQESLSGDAAADDKSQLVVDHDADDRVDENEDEGVDAGCKLGSCSQHRARHSEGQLADSVAFSQRHRRRGSKGQRPWSDSGAGAAGDEGAVAVRLAVVAATHWRAPRGGSSRRPWPTRSTVVEDVRVVDGVAMAVDRRGQPGRAQRGDSARRCSATPRSMGAWWKRWRRAGRRRPYERRSWVGCGRGGRRRDRMGGRRGQV